MAVEQAQGHLLRAAGATLGLAVSEWEAIRAYMEESPSASCAYLFGFLAIQFFSGWHLPCHVSAWVNRRPRASFPKEVLDWSQPLPSEQWAVPSEALKKQSADIRKAFAKGQDLVDYFKVPLSKPETEVRESLPSA